MRSWLALMGLLLSASLYGAGERPLQMEDFARGIRLQTDGSSPIYQLPIPLEVYRGIVRPDLSDLRLFNGNGDLIPHRLQTPPLSKPGEARRQPVAIFPLYGSRAADLQQLSLQLVQRAADGEIRLQQDRLRQTRDQVLRGYLVRLPELAVGERFEQLQLTWDPDREGFMQGLRVERSRDLEQWHTLAGKRVIADLRFAGERLLRDQLPLSTGGELYIRLRPLADEPMVPLRQASVEIRGAAVTAEPRVTAVLDLRRGEAAGEYRFELPGPLPVIAVTVRPGEVNTLARASLYSRVDDASGWRLRGQGQLYRLQQGDAEMQQYRLEVGRVNDRQWRLVVDAGGGGLGAPLPAIEVDWLPHRLRFAARGEPPYTLAFGSARVAQSPAMPLPQEFDEAPLTGGSVTPGGVFELAGGQALDPSLPFDWKQGLLWGVLILASLLLGWMAWGLVRQANR